MKIAEIDNQIRNSVKKLHNLYISYLVNTSLFNELITTIREFENSNDPILIRESKIIKDKLFLELIEILSK